MKAKYKPGQTVKFAGFGPVLVFRVHRRLFKKPLYDLLQKNNVGQPVLIDQVPESCLELLERCPYPHEYS